MIAAIVGLLVGSTSPVAAKPLKVFILAGQSNMQGHATIATFDYIGDDPATAPILKEMRDADGRPHVCDKVWISSVGCAEDDTTEQKGRLTAGFGASTSEIGPEFTFGIYIAKLLGEPILLIKTSWGGKSLHTDFRPPSAGPFVWGDYELSQCKNRGDDLEKDKAEKIRATGVYYRLMIEHVRKVLADIQRVAPGSDPKQGYNLAGFVWFQGFNDMVSDWTYPDNRKPGGYDLYSDLLADFIRDVRKDLSAPKMPFIIGVIGVGGIQEKPNYFRQAMESPAARPEFKGNVIPVQTAPFWDRALGEIEEKNEKVSQMAWILNSKERNGPNKDGKMTQEEQEAYLRVHRAKLITPEEEALWKRGASNGGYHYLGCAKTMALIGKAFAEAMANLQTIQLREKQ